jgi:hypothetical protein
MATWNWSEEKSMTCAELQGMLAALVNLGHGNEPVVVMAKPRMPRGEETEEEPVEVVGCGTAYVVRKRRIILKARLDLMFDGWEG